MRSPRPAAIPLVFVLLVSCCGLGTAESSPSEPCTLLVRLFNSPFDDETNVPTIPLTFDARIAMRAEIESVVLGTCAFKSGDRIVFLIHSPTRTMGGYWFDDKRFFLSLAPSDTENTDREWDLIGIDWPLDNPGPYPEVLICANKTYTVRTLVGDPDQQMFGPFSVFREGSLVVSLGTIETLRSKSTHENQVFVLNYTGDPAGRAFKPAVVFEAREDSGILTMGSEIAELECSWPSGVE